MPQAGPLVSELLTRLRDPQGTQHPRTLVRDLLDRCQVLLARKAGFLIRERDFPLQPQQLIYPIDPTATLRVVDFFRPEVSLDFTIAYRRLSQVRWPMLQHEGRGWWRAATSTGPDLWAPFGANYVLLYPGTTLEAVTLKIREQRRPAALDDDSVELEIPDDAIPELLLLVEALLQLRGRDPGVAQTIAQLQNLKPEAEVWLDETTLAPMVTPDAS